MTDPDLTALAHQQMPLTEMLGLEVDTASPDEAVARAGGSRAIAPPEEPSTAGI